MSETATVLVILVAAAGFVSLRTARSVLSTFHEYGLVSAAQYLLWLFTAFLSVLLFAMPPLRPRSAATCLRSAETE